MRVSTRNRWQVHLLMPVLILHSAACSDTHVGPAELSAVSITVALSGVGTNESFLIALNEGAPQPLSPASGFVFRAIPSGRHTLTLSGFGENCSVDGANPVVVDAPAAGEARVGFSVTCTSTTGIIVVAAMVAGSSDPIWLSLQVDSAPPERIRGNRTTPVGAFSGGAHLVRLFDVPGFCDVLGDDSTTVSIRTGGLTQDTVTAGFEIICERHPQRRSDIPAIAFQRADFIALVNEDGSGTMLLTQGVAPSWSPDGAFVAFQRPRCQDWGCNDDLWLIYADGSGEQEITRSETFYDSDPAISPDARKVAFVRFWNGPDQSYLMVTNLSGTTDVILSIWHPYSTPTWSPDGTQIAFTCEGPAPTWELDICVVKTAAGCTSYFVNVCQGLPAVAHLTSTRSVESEPAWSPDGARIAFTLACSQSTCPTGVDERESYIALLDPLTRSVIPLVPGNSPAWSPDGQRIVFVGNTGNPGLHIVGSDGAGLRRLTDDPRDSAPSWR